MLQKLLTAAFILCGLIVMGQYKNDNVLYKTIDPDDLCATLQKNSGYLLLDVRSSGENCDTSSGGINMGHLSGAKNIDVRELGGRLSEITAYKNQPVFVYCSHSQRSRRASQMLADSGFTKVFNINGGMTALYYTNAIEKDCLQSMVETNNKYAIVSAIDLCNKLSKTNNNIYILDVRPDSAFRHISVDARFNAYGSFRNAVNIPLADLDAKSSAIPKDKEIVVIDLFTTDAQKAASLLHAKGFKNVSVLIEGINRLLSMDAMDIPCKNQWYVSPVSYKIISSAEFGRFTQTSKDYLLLDIRTADEFANKYRDSWKNIGHLKNALNIPAADLSKHIAQLEPYKNKDIIIYGFSGDTESFATATMLSAMGFKKITVLNSGLFNIRWTAANHKGEEHLKDLVIDVPDVNK
jgi:rhodanese-related sulfurtransferase